MFILALSLLTILIIGIVVGVLITIDHFDDVRSELNDQERDLQERWFSLHAQHIEPTGDHREQPTAPQNTANQSCDQPQPPEDDQTPT